MKYNLQSPTECLEAKKQLLFLIEQKKQVEIKIIRPRRSLAQNNYLHLLLGAFGQHFGYTMPESKLIYKSISSDVYVYEKNSYRFWKSSAELDSADMTKTIDKFRELSAEMGYELPLATDIEWLRSIENEIERSKAYL